MADLGNSVQINAVPVNTWIMHFMLGFPAICFNVGIRHLFQFLMFGMDILERSPEQDSTTGPKAIYLCVDLDILSVKGFSLEPERD